MSATGTTLLHKMNEAKEERVAHQAAFDELNGALKPETTAPWKIEIEYWEDNPNDLSVNPFETKVTREWILYLITSPIY